MFRPKTRVLELSLQTRYPIEHLSRQDMIAIANITKRWARRAKHSKYTVSLVVVTNESPQELMDRIGAGLEAITAIERAQCSDLGRDVAATDGNMDPFVTFVREAWKEADRKNSSRVIREPKPKHVEEVRSPNAIVEDTINNFPDSTLAKVARRADWERKKQRDPYRD